MNGSDFLVCWEAGTYIKGGCHQYERLALLVAVERLGPPVDGPVTNFATAAIDTSGVLAPVAFALMRTFACESIIFQTGIDGGHNARGADRRGAGRAADAILRRRPCAPLTAPAVGRRPRPEGILRGCPAGTLHG